MALWSYHALVRMLSLRARKGLARLPQECGRTFDLGTQKPVYYSTPTTHYNKAGKVTARLFLMPKNLLHSTLYEYDRRAGCIKLQILLDKFYLHLRCQQQ